MNRRGFFARLLVALPAAWLAKVYKPIPRPGWEGLDMPPRFIAHPMQAWNRIDFIDIERWGTAENQAMVPPQNRWRWHVAEELR